MKKKLTPHKDNVGPALSIDLDDVSVIEEFGDRNSSAGWVEAVITLRYGKVIKVKLAYSDMDELIADWQNKPNDNLAPK